MAALRGLLDERAHRLGWGMADQAVSSLTNFAIVLYAVRTVDASQFGAFSLAYVTYGFVLSASRGIVTGPLQVRFSTTGFAVWRRAVAQCTGAAAVMGLVAGVGALVVALVLEGPARAAFLALGLTLPGLTLQDSWRFAFFALGHGSQAFLNDLVWALALLPALVLLRVTGHQEVFWLVFAWGAAAAVAAAVGAWQAGVVPNPSHAWGWVRQHGDLGFRFLAEYMSINGSSQLRTYIVGIIVGLTAVGYLQAANTVMGPFMVIYLGMTLVTVPEAVRALHRSPRHLRLFCALAGAILAVMCLAWGVFLLAALPRGLGEWLMGAIWRPAYPLVLPMTLSIMGGCIDSGAASGLHALGAARRSLRAGLIGSAIYLVSTLVGTLAGGVVGTVWGLAIATWVGALVWWWQLRAALLEFNAADVGAGIGPASPATPSTPQIARLRANRISGMTSPEPALSPYERHLIGAPMIAGSLVPSGLSSEPTPREVNRFNGRDGHELISSAPAVLRPRHGILLTAPPLTRDRLVRRRVYLTWFLLYFNTLTFFPGLSFLHIPSSVGKILTQGALIIALLCALSINRKVLMRPNVFLFLVTLIVLGAVVTTLQPQHFGTIFRTCRFAGFVATLWLLTPWWGRRDLLLLRCHLTALSVVLGSVVIGMILSPSHAFMEGRLIGSLWPMQSTQVAHYGAVTAGLVVVLWFCGNLSGRATALIAGTAGIILILSHTRTALVALIVGILVAGLSLIVVKPRVRKLFAAASAMAAVAALTLSAFITTWLARGQTAQGLDNLTGRTKVWGPLLAAPRNKFEEIFGFGLSSSSFDGLPIDSNWLASYEEEGLYGVVICATILLFLIVATYLQPRGLQRALALFLVVYCLVASFTEVGFTDVSPYLLDLTVAASLLVPTSVSGELA